MKMKKVTSVILSLVLAMGLAACGSSSSGSTDTTAADTTAAVSGTEEVTTLEETNGSLEETEAAEGTTDTLLIGTSNEPTTLDPHVHSNVSTRFLLQNIYRGLVGYNLDGEIEMQVAESYEISDDNLTYTFYLRDDVTFHDGTQVTASDVKYSFDRIMADDSTATYKSYFTEVGTTVNVVDDLTVEFVLETTCAPFLEYLSLPESAILSEAWMEAGNDITTTAMGCGPYQFVSWERGLEIDVEGYDGYYKEGYPKTKYVDFIFYTDETTRNNALLSGEVDLIDYVSATAVTQLEDNEDVTIYSRQGAFMMLEFNCEEGSPFADYRVRQAVAYAIDRQAVIDTAFNGRGEALYGFPTIAGQAGYNGEYDDYFSYDLDKAKELMAEAGYEDGFSCTILATSDYSFHEQTALVVQDCLADIGIEVTADLPDWATRLERSSTGDYDIIVCGTIGKILDMDWASTFYQSGEVRMDASPYFADDEIDNLLALGRSTLDEDERNEIYQEFREKALELSPLVYICYREQAFAAGTYVENFDFLSGSLSQQAGICLENVVVYEH